MYVLALNVNIFVLTKYFLQVRHHPRQQRGVQQVQQPGAPPPAPRPASPPRPRSPPGSKRVNIFNDNIYKYFYQDHLSIGHFDSNDSNPSLLEAEEGRRSPSFRPRSRSLRWVVTTLTRAHPLSQWQPLQLGPLTCWTRVRFIFSVYLCLNPTRTLDFSFFL